MSNKEVTNKSVSTYEVLKSIEDLAVEGHKVKISENQHKVMANKYLRGDSVEVWMRRICRNVALAELLYSKEISKEQILQDTNHEIIDSNFDSKT